MSQALAPGAGQDDEYVPPDSVTPDWVTDEDWDRICASRTAADEPDDLGEDWDEDLPADWETVNYGQFAAQAEAEGAEHEASMRRVLAAGIGDGYAHARGEPPLPGVAVGPAAGFGQGRCLDTALPCTQLSQLADEASGQDRAFHDVTDDQLLGILPARVRLESRAAWERLMAVAEFIRRRPEAGCALRGPGRMPRVWQLSAVAELRAQLHLTPGEASAMLDLAHDLAAKLLRTSAALRDGIIDLAKAQWMSWRCAPLTAAEARQVEDLIFGDPDVGEWTLGMFRDRVSQAVIKVNPQAAIKRREESARERRVEMRREDSGNAALVGRELPPSAVLAASQVLTARAKELRLAGVPGGMDELRVQAYLEKLGVLDPLRNVQPSGEPGGNPEDAPAPRAQPAGQAAGKPASGGQGDGAAAFVAKVNMTLPLATLLGLAERPGTLSGIGPIDPALVRDLAAAAARHPASTWCLTITGPDGRPVAHGCGHPSLKQDRDQRKHPPPAGGRVHYTRADDRGPPDGYGTVHLHPTVLAGTPGPDPGGPAPGDGPDPGDSRDLVFRLETLTGPCDHRHQAKGHDPGKMLRHLTGILNATCTFPPCRRPEHQADYEHSLPFDQGGKTCLCQAGPVCRTDHRAKQSPGWHLEQAGARGSFRWTTPSGRTYLTRPTQYPD